MPLAVEKSKARATAGAILCRPRSGSATDERTAEEDFMAWSTAAGGFLIAILASTLPADAEIHVTNAGAD